MKRYIYCKYSATSRPTLVAKERIEGLEYESKLYAIVESDCDKSWMVIAKNLHMKYETLMTSNDIFIADASPMSAIDGAILDAIRSYSAHLHITRCFGSRLDGLTVDFNLSITRS